MINIIDGIKLKYRCSIETALKINGLNWQLWSSYHSGKWTPQTITAKYKGLIITVKRDGTAELRGSIAKAHFNGKNTAENITVQQFEKTRKKIHKKFNIKKPLIVNIEVGVNILLENIKTVEVLEAAKYFRNTPIDTHIRIKKRQTAKRAIQARRIIKLYNKAQQVQVLKEVLRIEAHYKKPSTIANALTDWHKIGTPAAAAAGIDIIKKIINDLRYVDPENIDIKHLTRHQLKRLYKFADPLQWERMNKTQRLRANEFIRKINETHGKHNYSENITKALTAAINKHALKCRVCGDLITPPKRNFCSRRHANKHHNGKRKFKNGRYIKKQKCIPSNQ